jgi:hypothetical protein
LPPIQQSIYLGTSALVSYVLGVHRAFNFVVLRQAAMRTFGAWSLCGLDGPQMHALKMMFIASVGTGAGMVF